MLICIICQNEVSGDEDRCQFCGSTDFIKVVSKKNDVKANAAKTGFLFKQGGAIKSWKKRFFVLTQEGNLEYYMNDQLNTKQLYEQMGSVKVEGALVLLVERGVFDDRDGYLFAITPEKGKSLKETEIRQYVLEAQTEEIRHSWIQTLLKFGAVDGGEVGYERLNPDSIFEGTLTMFVKSPFAFIGTLTKKTLKKDMISNIKKRYCVLTVNELICYKTKQETTEAIQRLTITQDSKCAGLEDKEAADIGFDKISSFSVIEKAHEKPVYFSCRDATEKNDWITAIGSVISGNALVRTRKKTIAESLLEDGGGASPQMEAKHLEVGSGGSSASSTVVSNNELLYDDVKQEPKKKCSAPGCTAEAADGRDMCFKHVNESLSSQNAAPALGKKKKLLVVEDPNAKSSLSPAVSPAHKSATPSPRS